LRLCGEQKVNMKWIEAKVIFDHPDRELATDLISDVFYAFGLQGVAVEDPEIESDEDWAEDAVGRPNHNAVTGYLHKDRRAEDRCKTLEKKLARLKERIGGLYRVNYRELDEEDWAESWKAFFWPQKVGCHIVVKPTWREYRAVSGEIVIELDPGMAFGTGTHPTTALCVSMIEKYLCRGDDFLDVGTGSGILMIAAAKLGAGSVCGIDRDEVALEVAGNNLKLNWVTAPQFRLQAGNLVDPVRTRYHFIAANIFTHVVLELLDDIPRVLKVGGTFVCSGIIAANRNLVIAAMKNCGFDILEIAEKEEWVAIAARLKAKG